MGGAYHARQVDRPLRRRHHGGPAVTVPSPINAGLTLGFWTFGYLAATLNFFARLARIGAGYCLIRRMGMTMAQAQTALERAQREHISLCEAHNKTENDNDQTK